MGAFYEHRTEPFLPARAFAWRMAKHFAASVAIVLGSLGAGMAGFAFLEELSGRDAFLNAAMLLSGMGPVHMPASTAGKVFAGLFALYAGLVFVVVAGVVMAPVAHRLLHAFHWEESP